MAAKKAKTTSTGSFPTMGTSVATSVVNVSGTPSNKTKRVPKKGNSKGGMLEAVTASHRQGVLERLGAQLRPTAALYAPNAAEAGLTQRNTRVVPSAIGNRDFWAKRQYGQVGF